MLVLVQAQSSITFSSKYSFRKQRLLKPKIFLLHVYSNNKSREMKIIIIILPLQLHKEVLLHRETLIILSRLLISKIFPEVLVQSVLLSVRLRNNNNLQQRPSNKILILFPQQERKLYYQSN